MSGCAGERDPINSVQANVVAKSFFLGDNLADFRDDPEFRTKSFNIDSAANTDSYSATIGGASAVERIHWEITEGWLFGRRAYQENPGADKRGLPRVEVSPGKWEFPDKATGTIIAAYKITKHFDVRNAYNGQTGEENNVIEENDRDRLWFEREFMRVDWSQNLAKSTAGDTSWVFGGDTKANAIQYSPTDKQDPDAPNFDAATGYFDITNKYTVETEAEGLWGLPECVILGFFNGTTSYDCSPTEVKVRHSFVRLTGKEDFEPFEESLAQRDIIGNWGNAGNNFNREYGGAPISSWDPQYGYTDAKTKTFFALHNIWEQSHQQVKCVANADVDADGTADECANATTGYAGVTGSQCDIQIGKCTIPVRDRSVKTVGYWLNEEAPLELQDEVSSDGKTITRPGALEESTVTWNQLMKVAVATRREVECRRTKSADRDTCHAQFFDDDGTPASKEMVQFGGWGITKVFEQPADGGKPVVATCHNPVRAYDAAICGKPGEKIRLGDVRKNYAIYWPYASRAPYGGVASIGGDPLTGEMLGVTATTMMRSATAAAAQQRDILQLAMGDIQLQELIDGVPVSRFADLVKDGKVAAAAEAKKQSKTAEEIATLVANVQQPHIQAALGINPATLAKLSPVARKLADAKMDMKASPSTATIADADQRVDALLKQVNGGEFKGSIENRGLFKMLAQTKNMPPELQNAISSIAQQGSSAFGTLFDRYNAYLANKGVCFHDTAQAATAGSIYQPALKDYFLALYGNLDAKERGVKIYADLLRESVKGIAFHEIGHSLGMRHNFASSWDSMNFSPQYWQLRTNEGQATRSCVGPRTPGAPDSCMGPRYLDPATDDEQGVAGESRPGIEYFANTSTMEYQIERFGETVGAGTYDLHTMKTLYGRSLETFDDRIVRSSAQGDFAAKLLSQTIPDDLVLNGNSLGMHYTRLAVAAKVFNPARDCRDATAEEIAHAKWRIVHGKVCAPSPKNHMAYDDMKTSEIQFKIRGEVVPLGSNGVRWSGVDEAGTTLVRWPYRYGEDYSSGGYTHAKLFDSGADIYEITTNVAKRFDMTYPWQYFRRQNKEFAWWTLPRSVAYSTFSRIRGYHWSTTNDIARADAAALADDDQARPAVMASAEMFNFLQRAILMPEPGAYSESVVYTAPRKGALKILDLKTNDAEPTAANIGIIDGRFVQVDFDNDRGGSWDYNSYPKHTGFDEEKVLAIRELVDSRPTLSTVSRENALDGRDPYISFRTDTPHAVDRLVGSLLSEDWEMIAPSAQGSEATTLLNFNLLDPNSTKLVRPADSKPVFPNVGYSNQLGTGIYSMLFSRFSTDLTLMNKLRLQKDGDNGVTIPEARKIAFTDPVSGHRYLASRFGTETIQGRAVERGIASRMLEHANDLLAARYEVVVDAGGPVLGATGEPTLVLGTDGQPVSKGSAVEEKAFRRYVGLLDGMYQLSKIFGTGPLGGGGGGDEEE